MRDRLIDLLKQADKSAAERMITDYDEAIADNAYYLLDNGVIVPLIAVGGIAYVVPTAQNKIKEITEMRCIGYIIDEIGMNTILLDWKNKQFLTSLDNFGKSVFLTKEEAEQALARKKGGE